jgi:hypothetical protein
MKKVTIILPISKNNQGPQRVIKKVPRSKSQLQTDGSMLRVN